MQIFTSIGGIVTLVLAVMIFAGIVWLLWKRALLDIQSKALDVQQQAIKAYETRVEQLEAGHKESQYEIKRLEGVIQGKDTTLRFLIDSIAKTDRCINAGTGCPNRVIPELL